MVRRNCRIYGQSSAPDVLVDSRVEGRQFLGCLMIFLQFLSTGGSRGARTINTAMIDVHKHFQGKPGIKLIHITGEWGI